MAVTNEAVLDTGQSNELFLEILSFSGGENQTSEDHVTQANQARNCTNFAPISLGGMERVKGINQIASGAAPVTASTASLLGHFHYEDSSGESSILGVIDDDLVVASGAVVMRAYNGAGKFTADIDCTAVNGGDATWITNSTDNLHRYTIASGCNIPNDVPTLACEGIYVHKNRLFAEGGQRRVYSSRVGTGFWNAADTWDAANDASNIDLPDYTTGSVPNFPVGDGIMVFTKFSAYIVSGFPNVRYDAIPNSWGCSSRHTLAEGNGGLFGISELPNKCIFYYDRTKFVSITEGVDWIDDVDTSKRMYGIFRENEYQFHYNETGGTTTYPDKVKVFNVKWGNWYEREINSSVGDTLGVPFALDKQSNEMYAWSSQDGNIYEMWTGTDDEGYDTQCTYKTKNFTSRDFTFSSSAKAFPFDEVEIKLTRVLVQYYGVVGALTISWEGDYGLNSGSNVFDLTADGDILNSTFIVNTSKVITTPPDKVRVQSISNAAVGKRFNFQILHNGLSTRPEIKKIKIFAEAREEV